MPDRWWRSDLIVDGAFYAVIVAFAAITPVIVTDPGGRNSAWTALASWAVGYLLVGRRAARTGGFAAGMYAALLVLVTFTLTAVTPLGVICSVLAYLQIWTLATPAWFAILASAGVAVSTGLGFLAHDGFTHTTSVRAGAAIIVALAIALACGTAGAKARAAASERTRLVGELTAARDELAAIHHHDGVIAERERLAREIHDTLAQGFLSIVTISRTAQADLAHVSLAWSLADGTDGERAAPTESSRLARNIELIEAIAQENLDDARHLVAAFSNMRVPDVEKAVRRIADRCREETGLDIDIDWDTEIGPLPRPTSVIVLRTIQEAITNVRRHADASTVAVIVERVGAEVEVTVSDDGIGIAADTPEGFGLAGMRSRIEMSGGSLSVNGSTDDGTTISAVVPITAEQTHI